MTPNRRAQALQRLRRQIPLHLFLLGGVVLLLVFKYVPLVEGVKMAFQDFKPAKGFWGDQEWVGWHNFKYIFSLDEFQPILWNTVIIALSKMALLIVVPIVYALLINEVKHPKFRKVLQTLVIFPHFLSWILLAGVYLDFFSWDGAMNRIFDALGLSRVNYFDNLGLFRTMLIVTDVLKEFGYSGIIYLAAIVSIDQVQYESAALDGVTRLQRMYYVTLPNMQMIIVLMTVLSLGNVFNAGFDQVYNMINPSLYGKGEILDTWIYVLGLQSRKYSLSTALGLFKSVISTVFIGTAYFVSYKKADYVLF